ncbi:GntR family transcriptional regulator [Williamsia sp. CHRR-6]|uniref:GntR family transcriptional regulator n=1 Tax=Williamsia sp. CHRR-6 TaxID=2835871 RepID=UPI001BD9354D|nr:GntR family transcriptional regulator [Williamsia sp. CHRR-6]MBT0567792.1 GntR family transcriptional regulator [Williamsia sp. CHRR-6]
MTDQALTKSELIVDELRRLVLSGELARGERLRQDDLAQRFSASITPVREALQQLVAEGLLVSEPHRGVRVAGVDLSRITGVYVVRRLTEAYAMRRVVDRMSPRDLRAAQAILEQLSGAQAAGDAALARELNRRFHFHFYDRCGLPALRDEIAGMWRAFPWDLMLSSGSRMSQSAIEHAMIVDAVRAGDADRAAEVTEQHIMHGYLSLAEQIDGVAGRDPFDIAEN